MREFNNTINQAAGHTALVTPKEPLEASIGTSLAVIGELAYDILERERRLANAILGTVPDLDGVQGDEAHYDGLGPRIQADLNRIERTLRKALAEQRRFDSEFKF